VSLSSELPFERVVKHLKRTLGVLVHASTVRRQTLSAGQRVLEVQDEQAQPLSTCPEEKASERMAMSSDGSMVPLVGGVWAEVKVVAIGEVERRRDKDEEEIVTTHLTYFARLAPAATFADQASGEVRRRGRERARARVCDPGRGGVDPGVCAKPSARCAAHSRLCPCGWLPQPDRRQGARAWRASAAKVARGRLASAQTRGASAGAAPCEPLSQALSTDPRGGQLRGTKRRELMEYPTYRSAGWPIGSGSVESSHKLVVQARRVWARDALATRACQSHAGLALGPAQ
jgi:hypothetical protein